MTYSALVIFPGAVLFDDGDDGLDDHELGSHCQTSQTDAGLDLRAAVRISGTQDQKKFAHYNQNVNYGNFDLLNRTVRLPVVISTKCQRARLKSISVLLTSQTK